MVWVGLDEVVVAGVGVGRGERAGGDHGEVQDGGWGVKVSLLMGKRRIIFKEYLLDSRK